MKSYLQPLIDRIEATRNIELAARSKAYLKNQFEFVGTETKIRRQIINDFFKESGPLPAEKYGEFSLFLWTMPEREYQHIALDVISKHARKLKVSDIRWIEKLIITKSWWDTVDGIAAWICGTYFSKYPEQIHPVTAKWMSSGNMWLQRTSLLFQLKYKESTDTELLSKYILQLSSHKDFFIRKAIGWVLRQYSKTDPEWVRDFIARHQLSGLSYREASKYL